MPSEEKIKKKVKIGLRLKFIIGIFIIVAIITGAILAVGMATFWNSITNQYYNTAFEVTEAAAGFFTDEELIYYGDIAKKFNKGEISKEELDAVRSEERYKTLHDLVDNVRKGMKANDIYIAYFDVDVLRSYSAEKFQSGEWRPIYYIVDSYYDEANQFLLGDSSRMHPSVISGAIELWETGVIHNKMTITDGSFGYNLTATNLVSSDGKTIAVIAAEIPMTTLQSDLWAYTFRVLGLSLLITILIIIIYILIINRTMIRPIHLVASEAETFVENNTEISEKLKNIKTKDEIQVLSESILSLENGIIEYIDNITKITAEKERIGAELNVATQIQADMLPTIFPPYPERNEFDIYAVMDPAKEVGGDFYDFFLVDDRHIALVMADVSGKGVPAALFMVIAKTLIKNSAQTGADPSQVLADVNNQLCEGNKAELFVTVWLAVIDLETGEGIAANAGHEHPTIRRKDGSYELVIYRHAPAVAAMEGMRFKQHEFKLEPGDSLFVYTDGVPEATNANNELYGTDRMLDALNKDADASPRDILKNVKESVDEFVGDAPQFDDLTMLSFKYYGKTSKD